MPSMERDIEYTKPDDSKNAKHISKLIKRPGEKFALNSSKQKLSRANGKLAKIHLPINILVWGVR